MPSVIVEVKDLAATRARVGSGPITSAFDVSFDEQLSAAGRFEFKVPCRDPKSAYLVVQARSVDIYVDGADDPSFVGIVEEKARVIPSSGAAYYQVSGYALVHELLDESVGFLTLASGSAGVVNGPGTVLALHSGGWSLDTVNGNGTMTAAYYGRFVGLNCLHALSKLSERSGEHWIYRPALSGSDRKIVWIGAASSSSGIRAVAGGGEAVALESNEQLALITAFEEVEDGFGLVNRIYPYGAGQDLQNSALTIAATTRTSSGGYTISTANNYVQYNPDGYRIREMYLQFEDIAPVSNTVADVEAAANMVVDAAKVELVRRSRLTRHYRLTVAKLPSAVRPGQTLRVIYYEENLTTGEVIHDIDEDLIVLGIATNISNGGGISYTLDVSNSDRLPADDDDQTSIELEKAQVAQSHTQIGPSAYVLPGDEDFDDTTPAVLPFWLGKWIASIDQVLLWFKIEPLHSTVKTIGGDASVDVDIDTISVDVSVSVSTSVSVSGTIDTRHDHEIPGHQHTILLTSGLAPTYPIGFGGAGTAGGLVFASGAGGNIAYPTDSGSGGVTSEEGGSASLALSGSGSGSGSGTGTGTGTGSGTADLSTAITAEYGIYTETDSGKIIRTDSVANLEADMTLTINGDAYSGEIVAVGVDDYWALDLTADLRAAGSFLPAQEINTIEIVADTGKTGRVKAQLLIRASVQAVANL